MKSQGLRPGVQDGNRAGQGSQPTSADIMERFQGGIEEQSKAASSVGKEKRVQSRRHCEDQVEVLHR
jgi:hypothetical protein